MLKSLIGLLILVFFCSFNDSKPLNTTTPVNAVLGDYSYLASFGSYPTVSTGEDLRIITHLKYVEQILRNKDVSHLSESQKKNRAMVLDLLETYWASGEFPKNYDHEGERKPCFIDKENNICAVGYLVQQTAGQSVAEEINARYQYASIYDMDLPELFVWMNDYGLTLDECAMIQPAYGYQPTRDNSIDDSYGIASSAFSGTNIALSALNASSKSQSNNLAPVLGVALGLSQVTYGIAQYPEKQQDLWTLEEYRNEGEKVVSLLNIGIGTATTILSLNRFLNNNNTSTERTYSINTFSYPINNRQTAIGLSFSKTF